MRYHFWWFLVWWSKKYFKRSSTHFMSIFQTYCYVQKKKKALTGFEPVISCLLDRRFNQLSHRASLIWVVLLIVVNSWNNLYTARTQHVPKDVDFQQLLGHFLTVQHNHYSTRHSHIQQTMKKILYEATVMTV